MDESEIFLKELDSKLWTSADKLRSNLVECMVALPGQLFTNTQSPAVIGAVY